jgi:signal transduction histidine kinase/DNA-binding NarL/FixJ family response regulator/HPt (histidine-containing phosphotransfer) domain-containing protein
MKLFLSFCLVVCFGALLVLVPAPSAWAQDQRYFDSLHTAYAYATQDTERSDILLQLATAIEDADTATAMSYATQSYQFAEKAGDSHRAARFQLFVAKLYSNAGEYDRAGAQLLQTIKTAESIGDSELLAQAYSQLGWNDLEIASYDESLDYFLTGLTIVQARHDSIGIGNAFDNLGCLYLDQQEPETALKYLRLALAWESQSRNSMAVAAIYNNIGRSFNGSMRSIPLAAGLDSSLLYFRRSEEIYRQTNEHDQRARVLGNIGRVFENKGMLDSTLYYYRLSIEMHQTIGPNSIYMASAYAQLGNLFLVLHHADSAFFYLNLARSIDERIGAKRELVDGYLSLARAYAQTGNFESAYNFLQKGSALHDSIYNVDKSRILDDMEQKYEASKREREIATQNQEIVRQRIINYSIIGFAAVLCLVALIFYRNERQLQRINKELAAAKERAETSERLEHQFLANMSHEIRTPMNAVLGMTTLLLDTPLSTKQRDYLEAIQSSADNLLVIINDILDLSKLQAGKMEFEHIPFRLQDVTGHAMEIMHLKAEAHGITLTEEIAESTPRVVIGDPARLSQVLMNLLSNAVKFTEHGSVKILVSASIAGDRHMNVRIAVRDTGIGIPREKLSSIFDSFSQADAETSRRYGGTGLGLTISRTLVELQGGHIGVESEPGQGSEFAVTIPYEVASEDVLIEPEETASVDAASLRGMRVLLVEDNEYNQIVLTDTLRNMIPEVAVELASNGLEAITLLQNFAFDLVLMDVQMPEMDGIEATKHIRAHLPRGKRDVPIIALTASVIKSEIDRCFAAGMNDYVPKPFKQDELFRVIAKYYRGKVTPPAAFVPERVEATPTNFSGQTMNGSYGSDDRSLAENERSSTTPVTDLNALREITGGNDEQLKKYIRMFLEGVPGQLESVTAALNQNDLDNVRRRVHAMKPHLKFMGMSAAAGFAESVEQLCAEPKNAAQASETFALVRSQCEQAIAELKERL